MNRPEILTALAAHPSTPPVDPEWAGFTLERYDWPNQGEHERWAAAADPTDIADWLTALWLDERPWLGDPEP